jgi:hypothetical protein
MRRFVSCARRLVVESHLSGIKSRGPLTIPFRIETLKRLRLQSHCRPRCLHTPRPPRLLYSHDLPGTNALFVSLKTAFHRSTATGIMLESTRFGATCSESILTRRHATTTAFEAFISLTPIPPRSRNQSSVRSLPVEGWSCKVKIITRVIQLGYITGLSKSFDLPGGFEMLCVSL